MARPIRPDAPWAVIEPVLPASPQPGGRAAPLTHRRPRTGVRFVLEAGIPWEDRPAERGCGSGMSRWRRPAGWPADGATAPAARGAAGAVAPRRPDRLVPGGHRLVRRAGRLGGPRPGRTRRTGRGRAPSPA